MAESTAKKVQRDPLSNVMAKVAAAALQGDVEADRITIQRHGGSVWVYRVYPRGSKDYDGGTVSLDD